MRYSARCPNARFIAAGSATIATPQSYGTLRVLCASVAHESAPDRPAVSAPRAGVRVGDLGSRGDHQAGERGDQFARLVQVDLCHGIRALAQPQLHRSGAHQVHRDRVDQLDGRHFADVAHRPLDVDELLAITHGRFLC
jgi:hypothetical protein